MKDILLPLPGLPSDQTPARALVRWERVVFWVEEVPTKAEAEKLMLQAALEVLHNLFGYVPSIPPVYDVVPAGQTGFEVEVRIPHIANPVSASRARLAGL